MYLCLEYSDLRRMMNNSQQLANPADLRNVVTEILQSEDFRNQLRCSFERATSSTVTNHTINSSTTSAQRNSVTTPAQELRRLFPSIRGSHGNEIRGGNTVKVAADYVSDRKKRKRAQKMPSDFKRDVILLSKPEDARTLVGVLKGCAYANGYAVTAATFEKTWTEREIVEYIKSLFPDKLGDTKFEILIPFGRTLVRPNLAEGTDLDRTIMCRLFSQKPVYIRPLSVINYNSEVVEKSTDSLEGSTINENDVIADNPVCDSSDNESNIENIFERDTTLAIARSIETTNENKTMIDILRQFHNNIDSETPFQFNVYREDIFHCCVRALRRKSFSPTKKISVLFTDVDDVSEGAVDMGGPTREMFRLLLKYLASSTLFEGPEHYKNITLCNDHLDSKHYYEAGRMIALSIIHGGPSPEFLSETLYNYIISGTEAATPSLEEIVNPEIRTELEKVRTAADLPSLQLAIWNSTFLTIAGFTDVASFDKKDTILKSAPKHYLIYRTMPALEQFKEGLNTLGLLDKLKEFKELLCFTGYKLTASKVSSIFTVKLSEIGSNSRNIESRILTFWKDFLCDCEERETQATLEDVLCFATASETIPPLGFETPPKLEFLDDQEFLWPKANTCVPILYLPISYKRDEYEKFRTNMDFGILNGMQFGFA